MVIIPKSSKQQKLFIYKRLTIIDIIVLFFYIIFSCIVGFGLTSIFDFPFKSIVALLLSIIVFGLLCITLKKSTKDDCKIYYFLFKKIIFMFKRKTYLANEKNDFLKYRSIFKDSIEIDNGKNVKYMQCLELSGLNISFLSEKEKNLKIVLLQQLLTNIQFNFSIVKLNQTIDLTAQIHNYQKYLKKNEDSNLTENELKSRKIQLENTIKFLSSPEQDELLADELGTKYLIFVYAKNNKNATEYINILSDKLASLRLSCHKVTPFQTVRYLHAILNPTASKLSDEIIEKNKKSLINLFKLENLKFHSYFIESKNVNYQISLINELPTKPNFLWLEKLFSYPNTCIIHSSFIQKEEQKRIMEKSIFKSNVNVNAVDKLMDLKEQQQAINLIESLADNIAIGNDCIRDTKIVFINYAPTKELLISLKKEFARFMVDQNCRLNRFYYSQNLAIDLLGINDEWNNKFESSTIELPNSAFAFGFPFTNSNLNDTTGSYIGTTDTGNSVFLDMCLVNSTFGRQNRNGFIIGKTGSGKSSTAKKILYDMIIRGYKCIVFDPEREYKQICKSFDGLWIDMADADQSKINPLQILPSIEENEDGKINQNKQIQNYLLFLKNWFKALMPELSADELSYIIQMINELYVKHGIYELNIKNADSKEFPTFNDLFNYLEHHENTNFSEQNTENYILHKKWIKIIKNEFIDGIYSELYNGYSQLKLNSRKLVVFDLLNLNSNEKPANLVSAQLTLLLNFCQKEIKQNREYNQKHPDKANTIYIVVDEAHTFIDENNPVGLDFLFQTVKRIRKYDGGILLITQNPHDFIGTAAIARKTTAIMNNMQYNFILNLNPNDVDAANKMYYSMGGLTQREENYILSARSGQALLIIDQNNRFLFQVEEQDFQTKTYQKERVNNM